MSDSKGQPPEGNKDANVRSHLQQVARGIDDLLPENWGFLLLCQPFGDAEGRCNYISNIQREDAVKMAEGWLQRQSEENFGKHV